MKPNTNNDFDDIRAQNLVLYGDEMRRTSPTSSFWYDILPHLFLIYIQSDISKNDYEDVYDEDVPPLAKVFNKAYNIILRILFYFIETPSYQKATDEEIAEYQKRNDLLGIIANLYDKVDEQGYLGFKSLLNFLSHHQDYQIKLKDFLPKTLTDGYIRDFKGIFYLLAKEVKNKKIQEEIDKFKFLVHPEAISGVSEADDFKIIKTDFTRSIVLFRKASFGSKETTLFWDLLTTNANLVEGVFFIDCIFLRALKTKAKKIYPRVMFKNCIFESKVNLPKQITRECNFVKCVIKGPMSFEKVHFYQNIRFMECNFTENSHLNFNKAIFKPVEAPVETQIFIIKDCIFNGELFFKDISIECDLSMANLAFFAPFHFDNTKFGYNCSFDKLAFTGGTYPKMEHCKQILGERLIKCGYTSDASKLGLAETTSKENQFDHDAYQTAIKNGWLNPKQAARFLGKSIRTLQEKRKKDKYQITRDSIPFIGEGKDILYPLEALKAYLAQDWNLLKELRKKHWKKD